MNIDFAKINSVNFDVFNSIIVKGTDEEFYGVPGKEHYRLLAYLSTLVNNATILDIGTHMGSSALALSYNESNTVISYDIVTKNINPSITARKNIQWKTENLLYVLDKELIMSCPIIFLDIDPHYGVLEYQFYMQLKEWSYAGILICDDIWHFEDMRNNFWYKIEDQYKYDITDYGHFSGTGIVSFKPLKLEKHINDNWTLVTAYYNLTKCPDASTQIKERDQKYYMKHSYSTLSLPNNLVIYCDQDSYDMIYQIRPEHLRAKTKYVIGEFDDFKVNGIDYPTLRDTIINNRITHPYNFDPRNTASYYLFCISRYIMLLETIASNPFNSTHFSWINICIQRMGLNNVRRLPEALSVNRDKFSTVYIDYIPKEVIDDLKVYWQQGYCSMCSGFFTGNAEYMGAFCTQLLDKFIYFLSLMYGHSDEQLYSPVFFDNKIIFEHFYGDYQEMITNYVYSYDNPDKIINIFIPNSHRWGDYDMCSKACEYLFKSVKNKKCCLSNDELYKVVSYYYDCLKR